MISVPLRWEIDKPPRPDIEAELAGLPALPIVQLRARYRELFQAKPPQAFGPDLLRRTIAYRIQEKAYGGLSKKTQHLLNRLVKDYRAKPNSRIELPRRVKPGSVLVRDWKGRSHRVMVEDQGFTYAGQTYASLSEIARFITGTNWNGPRFFGLRANNAAAQEPAETLPPTAGRIRTNTSAGHVRAATGGITAERRKGGPASRPQAEAPGNGQ
ncbi:MAG: DUF2924 domain-containing protein [Xanthobacteraceae bacterium]|nr:MAG: DUF2924 domain-containing protein [Xanthobacteraceae bacterium]